MSPLDLPEVRELAAEARGAFARAFGALLRRANDQRLLPVVYPLLFGTTVKPTPTLTAAAPTLGLSGLLRTVKAPRACVGVAFLRASLKRTAAGAGVVSLGLIVDGTPALPRGMPYSGRTLPLNSSDAASEVFTFSFSAAESRTIYGNVSLTGATTDVIEVKPNEAYLLVALLEAPEDA